MPSAIRGLLAFWDCRLQKCARITCAGVCRAAIQKTHLLNPGPKAGVLCLDTGF